MRCCEGPVPNTPGLVRNVGLGCYANRLKSNKREYIKGMQGKVTLKKRSPEPKGKNQKKVFSEEVRERGKWLLSTKIALYIQVQKGG